MSETLQIKKKKSYLSTTRMFEWHKRFKESRESIDNDARSGRPSTSHYEENQKKK